MEVFRYPKAYSTAVRLLFAVIVAALVLLPLLPGQGWFEDEQEAWMVTLLAAVVLVPLALFLYGRVRRLDDRVVVDEAGVHYKSEARGTTVLPWSEIAGVHDDPLRQHTVISNRRGTKRLKLSYRLEDFARLRAYVEAHAPAAEDVPAGGPRTAPVDAVAEGGWPAPEPEHDIGPGEAVPSMPAPQPMPAPKPARATAAGREVFKASRQNTLFWLAFVVFFLVVAVMSYFDGAMLPAVGFTVFAVLGLLGFMVQPRRLTVTGDGLELESWVGRRRIRAHEIAKVHLRDMVDVGGTPAQAVILQLQDGEEVDLSVFRRDPVELYNAVNASLGEGAPVQRPR